MTQREQVKRLIAENTELQGRVEQEQRCAALVVEERDAALARAEQAERERDVAASLYADSGRERDSLREQLTLSQGEARTLRADVARLREALTFYAKEPCMMRNGIHCTMVPAGVQHRVCGPCEVRAALAATAERGK